MLYDYAWAKCIIDMCYIAMPNIGHDEAQSLAVQITKGSDDIWRIADNDMAAIDNLPNAKIVFVGPCAAKKLEASRRHVRSDVDFVLTFEELQGMFAAKDIDWSNIVPDEDDVEFSEGTGAGRGFAVGGGVAAAVVDYIKKIDPEREVMTEYGDGLKECKKMLLMAKAGKRNGYLLEGMGCIGGCVAGAGTIAPVNKAKVYVTNYKAAAEKHLADESEYIDRLEEVLND